MRKAKTLFFVMICMFLVMAGCAKTSKVVCNTPTDNPPHHYFTGMELIDKGDFQAAEAKFQRAITCDDEFAPAYAGLALVEAHKAAGQKDPQISAVYVGRAMDNLEKADDLAESNEHKFIYYVTAIRVYTQLKQKDWLDKCEDMKEEALDLEEIDFNKLPYYQGKEAVHYFMGNAYLEAREFDKARDSYRNVLNMSKTSKWHLPAEKGWKKVDKIVRAMAGISIGDVAKEIAVKDRVSRADLAALLVDELRIEKVLAGRIPVQSQIKKMKPEFIPADILNHPFRSEIETLLKWNVRGMEPKYDQTTKAYLFKPDEPVTRKEFAFILEDVLVKITGDEGLPTKYFGQRNSPFPDVSPSAPWFNAVMNATTRGLMETELSGEFRPDDYVDGAEAILAIRVLRETLNVY
jgi:tetratricopeptide (TPR) repeat protein